MNTRENSMVTLTQSRIHICIALLILVLLVACTPTSVVPPPETPRIGGGEGKQCLCTAEYRPVCGSDGKTYSNACAATCVDMQFVKGACVE